MGQPNRVGIQQQARAALKNGTNRRGIHWGSGLVAKEMGTMLRNLRGATIGEAEAFLGESMESEVISTHTPELAPKVQKEIKNGLTSLVGNIIAYSTYSGPRPGQL